MTKVEIIQVETTVIARTGEGQTCVIQLRQKNSGEPAVLESVLFTSQTGFSPTLEDALRVSRFLDVPPSALQLHSHDGRPLPTSRDAAGLTSCHAVALFGTPEAKVDLLALQGRQLEDKRPSK